MQAITASQSQLTHYEAACRALALAKTTDEAKEWRDKAAAIKAYAQQAKNRELEIDAAEIRIRAERRIGELIREQKETVGLNRGGGEPGVGRAGKQCGSVEEPHSAPPTLADAGIDKKLSSHAQKVAEIPPHEFEEIVGEWRRELQEANARVTANILIASARDQAKNHRTLGTGNNEWHTPQEYVDLAREVMGSIDTDPASSEIANARVRATVFYTAKNCGVNKPWMGNVWMNPPYATPIIGEFARAVVTKFKSGEIRQACVLVNNCTETAWFQSMMESASAFCFPSSRINFLTPSGDPAQSPLQGQCVLYFGENVEKFAAAFSKKGMVLRHV